MTVTVIVCTYNRSKVLGKALESIASSAMPDSVEWEILVVDNNSTDRTQEIVERVSRLYPGRFRYLFEAQQGLSHARNAGIREARGDILVFTDDDITVDPNWLHNISAVFAESRWAGAGGRIRIADTFSPPRWMALEGPYSMGTALCAHFDLGETRCELDRSPFGANMAFRKEMFERYGGFRGDLGRSAGNTLSCEDVEFSSRLLNGGERLCYEAAAVVYHPVHESRLQKRYFLSWWFELGRAGVRMWGRKPNIWGIPRGYLHAIKIGAVAVLGAVPRWALMQHPQQRFFWKCRLWMAAGQIAELCRQARNCSA